MPSHLIGRIGAIVLGFSKKSSLEAKGWGDSVLRDYGTNRHIVYYQMPVLAHVPTLVRGLILQGIRKQMSPAERMHFVPILQVAAEWKKVVQFAAPDDADPVFKFAVGFGTTGAKRQALPILIFLMRLRVRVETKV